MPFDPVSNTVFCEIRWQHGTNLGENTAWYKYDGSPPTNSELANLCVAVGAGLGEAIRLCMHNGVVMREVHCRDMGTEVAAQATVPFASGTSGARAGSPVASNEAANIVRRTGLTGRTQHGSIRVSEFVEGDVDGNTIGSGLMGLLGNVAIALLQDYLSNRFIAALGSHKLGTSSVLADAGILDSNVDSQKTRLNSHGA